MTTKLFIIIICLLVFVVAVLLSIIYFRLNHISLERDIQEYNNEVWKDKVLDKIKDKITVTNLATAPRKRGEDIVSEFIYQKEDIKHLGIELSEIYSQQVSALKSKYPDLTDLDILVIILLGIGMDNQEIYSLLRIEKRTLYRRRQLISQRIGISSLDLEQFAQNVIGV